MSAKSTGLGTSSKTSGWYRVHDNLHGMSYLRGSVHVHRRDMPRLAQGLLALILEMETRVGAQASLDLRCYMTVVEAARLGEQPTN